MHNTAAAFAALALTFAVALPLAGEPSHETGAPTEPPEAAIATPGDDDEAVIHDASGGTAISGFFDVSATAHRASRANVTFGSFELGMARPVGTRASLLGAVVMNEDGAQLTTGLLDIRLSPANGTSGDADTLRLLIGRFDVPFGRDWQDYASKDRIGISAPLTTDTILEGGLNATGVNFAGTSRSLDYSVFALRRNTQTLAGGRLGISSRGVTAGMSLMQSRGSGEQEDTRLIGLDADVRVGHFHLRAERVGCEPRRAGETHGSGWHVTVDADVVNGRHATWTPFARYEKVSAPAADPFARIGARDPQRRLTAGINTTVAQIVTFKLEYQRRLTRIPAATHEKPSDDSWVAQIVVFF